MLALVLVVFAPAHAWEQWGGDAAGTRFSPLQQITPANVDRLVKAWEFHTGDLARPPALMARTKFEATPLFVEDSLIALSRHRSPSSTVRHADADIRPSAAGQTQGP